MAASAAPSTQHTPSGEFSVLGDFEEDRKPNIEYLDSLNEHNKRSRSAEDDGAEADSAAERKLARVVGWEQGQAANGDVPMNNLLENGSGVMVADVDVDAPPEDDPIVNGQCSFLPSYAILCSLGHSSGWQTYAVLPGRRGTP